MTWYVLYSVTTPSGEVNNVGAYVTADSVDDIPQLLAELEGVTTDDIKVTGRMISSGRQS